jgi:hypothetical protein
MKHPILWLHVESATKAKAVMMSLTGSWHNLFSITTFFKV